MALTLIIPVRAGNHLLLAFCTCGLVIFVASWSYQRWRDVTHPLVFPPLYLAYALLAPWMYAATSGANVGRISEFRVNSPTAPVLILTVLTWVAGTLLATAQTPRAETLPLALTGLNSTRLLTAGRGLLVVLVIGKFVQIALRGGRAYGEGQVVYSAYSAVTAAVQVLLVVAVLFVVLGNREKKRVLTSVDLILVGAIAFLALVFLGSRGELIAPAVLVIWGHAQLGSARLFPVILTVLATIPIFIVVGNVRGEVNTALSEDPVSDALGENSSVFFVTDVVIQQVPGAYPYLDGSTYLESIKMLLPGVITRSSDETPETGAYAFRAIIKFDDPNQGFGFALPAEAFLNFGVAGVWGVSLLLGYLFGTAYRFGLRQRRNSPTRLGATAFAYAILLASFPYNIRSDALGQLKSTLYPMILLAVVLYAARLRHSHSGRPEITSTEV